MDLREWWWIIISLPRWWLQLQLLYQMWFYCLSELTHPFAPDMLLLTWRMFFSPYLLTKTTRRSWPSADKGINIPSLSCLRSISTLHPSVIIGMIGTQSPFLSPRQYLMTGWLHWTTSIMEGQVLNSSWKTVCIRICLPSMLYFCKNYLMWILWCLIHLHGVPHSITFD